jgi:hypothetical protein
VRYDEKPPHWAWYAVPIVGILLAFGIVLGWFLMWRMLPVGQ